MLWVGLEVNVEKTKVRTPSALQIAIGQGQPENVENFSCLGIVATNVVRLHRKLVPGVPLEKQHSTRRRLRDFRLAPRSG